jgi:hypothetical protein
MSTTAFAQFIVDKMQEFFPERNYNRAIKPMTEYFGDKFDILPESIREHFLHATSAADEAAKMTEQHRTNKKEMFFDTILNH